MAAPPPASRPSFVGALLARGTLALVIGALTLGLVELALRAADLYAPTELQPLGPRGVPNAAEAFTRPDDLLIYTVAPNARTFPWYAIDEHGYRTPPFEERKPRNMLRVVVTGDSSTFGLGVREEEHWPSLLRRALVGLCEDACAVEVVNAGTSGYSTLQNRLQIERDLLPLDPDLVVVLVSGANDATFVVGPGDVERSAGQRSLGGRLTRLRVARLFGYGAKGWGAPSGTAVPGTPGAHARVSVAEVEENLAAIAGMLPGRLVLGLFVLRRPLPERPDLQAIAERVVAVAEAWGIPLADTRPAIGELLPYPLYLDLLHPTPTGHAIIARTVLLSVLPRLVLPEPRGAWVAAWAAALAGDLEAQAAVLRGEGVPPRFRALVELYAAETDEGVAAPDLAARRERRNALDLHIAEQDPGLPPAVRDCDPLYGNRCRARSSARLLLGTHPEAAALREEVSAHVWPADPLLACFADDEAFLAAGAATRNLARALVVFGAEIGLPPIRADVRRGLAEEAGDPAQAVALLEAVLALEPADAEARYDLAIGLRRAGRGEEATAQFAILARGEGPLADFARAVVAFAERDLAAAELALRETPPVLGWARWVLGQVLLQRDQLDDAARELAAAAVLLGGKNELPAVLKLVEARRRQVSTDGIR